MSKHNGLPSLIGNEILPLIPVFEFHAHALNSKMGKSKFHSRAPF